MLDPPGKMRIAAPLTARALCLVAAFAAVASGWYTESEYETRIMHRDRLTHEIRGKPSNPPPGPPFPPGTSFAATFTDGTVFQAGNAHAQIFGVVVGGVSASTTVTLQVEDNSDPAFAPVTVTAKIISIAPGGANLTWKALLPPHPEHGGDVAITASCAKCGDTTATTISGLTYGDVWLCSGQSNMELPMAHALTRNRTYAAVDSGTAYQNIRVFQRPGHWKFPDGQELWVLPLPPNVTYNRQTGLPNAFYGWHKPNSTMLEGFSAACWYFAQELTDLQLAANKTAPVIGLIQTAWGGTEINDWIPNATIPECKNASGGTQVVKPGDGALWNGMSAPFVNVTIFGVLWYQGENNVYQCVEPDGGRKSGAERNGELGPYSCGSVTAKTGYACSTLSLVSSWRRFWSGAAPNTTSPTFPFGIVTLAPSGSEGHTQNMADFRHAQTAGYGFLPGPPGSGMENTFVAQGYDAGDPGYRHGANPPAEVDEAYQGAYDYPFPGRVGYTAGGRQSFTHQFMGTLHPRSKQTIGRRLALAADAVAYGNSNTPFTGPVIKNCTVWPESKVCQPGDTCKPSKTFNNMRMRQITVFFDESLLGTDAVKIWPTDPDTQGLTLTTMWNCLNATCLESCGANATCVYTCAVANAPWCSGYPVEPYPGVNIQSNTHFHFATGQIVSPLEVQLNSTIWMPVQIADHGVFGGDPISGKCRPGQCTNWTRSAGWNTMIATVPTALPLGCQDKCPPSGMHGNTQCRNCTHSLTVTGLRYAWGESPCCGGNPDVSSRPCPVNSCPVSTWNSTLPAAPFTAKIVWGNTSQDGVGTCECFAPQRCS